MSGVDFSIFDDCLLICVPAERCLCVVSFIAVLMVSLCFLSRKIEPNYMCGEYEGEYGFIVEKRTAAKRTSEGGAGRERRG